MIQFPAKERRGVGGRRLATNIIDRRDSVEHAKEAGYKSYNKQGSAQCPRAIAALVAATKEGDVPPAEKFPQGRTYAFSPSTAGGAAPTAAYAYECCAASERERAMVVGARSRLRWWAAV